MSFYGDMQGLAQGLLQTFNQGSIAVSVATVGGTAYEPTTTYADVSVNGTVAGVAMQYVDGTLVQATDLQVTFPGGIVDPKAQDKIKIGGVVHSIVRIIAKPATGVIAAYVVIVRK